MNAKFSAEVSNGVIQRNWRLFQMCRGRHVRLKTIIKFAHSIEVDRIRSSLGKPVRRSLCKQLSGIMFALFPNLGIEIAKDTGAIGSPAPPIVPGQTLERN